MLTGGTRRYIVDINLSVDDSDDEDGTVSMPVRDSSERYYFIGCIVQ